MNDLKITISRSFSRKINLGNYETIDLFASYSEEIPSDTTEKEQKEISKRLYERAKGDVLAEKKEILEQMESLKNGERQSKIQEAKESITKTQNNEENNSSN